MAKRGRPVKQPVAKRIEDSLGAAEQEINEKVPVEIQKALVPEVLSPVVVTEQAPKISKDAQDDYDFARTNLHSLLVKGNEVLEGITELAKSSDHPRTYEVAGGVLKVLIEGTRELMSLQKDIREIEKKMVAAESENETPPVSIGKADQVNNIVLETTTMDMLDILEAAKKKREQKDLEGN